MHSLMGEGDLTRFELAIKLLSLESNGVNMFQGFKIGDAT